MRYKITRHIGTWFNRLPPLALLEPLIDKVMDAKHHLWDGEQEPDGVNRLARFDWDPGSGKIVKYIVVRALWAYANNNFDPKIQLFNDCGVMMCVNPTHISPNINFVHKLRLPDKAALRDGTAVKPMVFSRLPIVHIMAIDSSYTFCGAKGVYRVGIKDDAQITCESCYREYTNAGYSLVEIFP